MGYPEAQYTIDEIVAVIKAGVPLSNNSRDGIMSSAALVCKGIAGTTFTIKRDDGLYDDIISVIDETSYTMDDVNYYRANIVPVPLGEYTVDVYIGVLDQYCNDIKINVSEFGVHYTIPYEAYELIQTFTESGEYVVDDLLPFIYVTAAGGGGGGGGGGSSTTSNTGSSYGYSASGGGGGGASLPVLYKEYKVDGLDVVAITVGTGGAGGSKAANGKAGGSTIVGDLITVAGGAYGGKGANKAATVPKTGGAGGKYGGGMGGSAYGYASDETLVESSSGKNGTPAGDGCANGGVAGTTGSTSFTFGSTIVGGSGGGGGGSLGVGGNGGKTGYYSGSSHANPSAGVAGSLGSGGGGGGGAGRYNGYTDKAVNGAAGGAGGNGVVYIYKGVQVRS